METIDNALTRRHFVSQADRPHHLGKIDLGQLDPALRCLLFTDGTVTRTLEAQTLSRISVEVLAQHEVPVHGWAADHLAVPPGTDSVRRRVAIGASSETPVMWAESHIVPSRLPADFLGVLEGAPEGIGQSLQQVQLESWRDMLWFGLDRPPSWGESDRPPGSVLTRLYRVITGGRPALLISESFAVTRGQRSFELAWSA